MATKNQAIDREEVARYRTQVQRNPESPPLLREAVEYFLQVGLPHEAVDPLARLAELQPEDTSVWLLLGVVNLEMGRVDDAERAFMEVTRHDPRSIAAYHNLALLYFATDRADQAEKQLLAILRVAPDDREALNDLAVLYATTGRDAEAQQTFERCLTVAPDYKKGWQNALDFAKSTGRLALGEKWAAHLIEFNPADPDLAGWRREFTRNSPAGKADAPVTQQSSAPCPDVVNEDAMSGTVSVIIPAYNAEQSVADTVESALNQTHADLEVIVVNDGSTDETEAALDPFRDKITYIHRVHQGWASAVNDGIQHSRGKWILPVNPGDILKPEAVQKQIDHFLEHPAHDVVWSGDASGLSHAEKPGADLFGSVPLFRRRVFVRLGFFDEASEDDDGVWSRRLMAVKVARSCPVGNLAEPILSRPARAGDPDVASPEDEAYRTRIMRRWVDETGNSDGATEKTASPAIKTKKRTGLSILMIGADDPGGMFSALATAVNEYTPHRCRVLARTTSGAYNSQVLLEFPRDRSDVSGFEEEARSLAGQADWLIFTAGIAPGAARRDRRFEDTDEVPWGALDWTAYTRNKKCAAFLCSSPSVRGNYGWYHHRFARRGWPVLTSAPDIYLNVPDAHFVPPVIDLSIAEYTRREFSVGPVAVVHHDRPGHAAGAEQQMLAAVAGKIKAKYGEQVLFGRCTEMSLRDTLLFRQNAHIGLDRLSFGAPRFGLTSLENSALGLVNIVYLDPFARALLARTLGTDEMPWLSPDSATVLYDTIDRFAGDHDYLLKRMKRTAEWFHRFWIEQKMIQWLTRILEKQ
jgi:tetratricopeptide (TPR) repeat protein